MIIQDQFGTIQNLQRALIPQTRNYFFAISYSKPTLISTSILFYKKDVVLKGISLISLIYAFIGCPLSVIFQTISLAKVQNGYKNFDIIRRLKGIHLNLVSESDFKLYKQYNQMEQGKILRLILFLEALVGLQAYYIDWIVIQNWSVLGGQNQHFLTINRRSRSALTSEQTRKHTFQDVVV